MFVPFDPERHEGKQLYAPAGLDDGKGGIAETLQPVEGIPPDLIARFAHKFWVWDGEEEPSGQESP